MKKMDVLNTNGEKIKDITLDENIFGIVPNNAVLYDAIKLSQNNARQGTRGVKGRSDVSGGGRKPWRQKGTGRARQGSTRAPHWYHGAWSFGNQERDYAVKQNRKERTVALKSALAYKVINKELVIVDSFNVESHKTKEAKKILKNFKIKRNALIVVSELNDNLIMATRNLRHVLLLSVDELNVLDLISANTVIIEESAIKTIEEALA